MCFWQQVVYVYTSSYISWSMMRNTWPKLKTSQMLLCDGFLVIHDKFGTSRITRILVVELTSKSFPLMTFLKRSISKLEQNLLFASSRTCCMSSSKPLRSSSGKASKSGLTMLSSVMSVWSEGPVMVDMSFGSACFFFFPIGVAKKCVGTVRRQSPW